MPQYFGPEQIAHYAQQGQLTQDPSASKAKPDHGLMHKLGLPVFIGGNAADLITTLQAIDRGGVESNPLLPKSKAGITAVKAATTAGGAFLLDKLANKNKKAALIAALVGGAIPAMAAVHNSQVNKK